MNNNKTSPMRRRLLGAAGAGLALSLLPPLAARAAPRIEMPALPDRVDLGVAFGRLGPALLEAGAIDPERFIATYRQSGQPLNSAQLEILLKGSERTITFDQRNAYFLLNFLWALGLINASPILTEGQMMQGGLAQIGRFASTGGWTLGQRSPVALYASTPLIELTPAQHARVREVATGVYRPCCGNPTSFPDCNHGMAMLGLLQVLAAQDADAPQLFAAAKAANRFWYPSQTMQVALYLQAREGIGYAQADGRQIVGRELFSGTGFKQVSAWLTQQGLTAPRRGGQSCSV